MLQYYLRSEMREPGQEPWGDDVRRERKEEEKRKGDGRNQ